MNSPALANEAVALGEEDLVQLLRSRSQEAWSEVYRRHVQQIYAYVFYRLHDQHKAEDLASQVFVEALEGIDRYRYTGRPFLAWLYRIAHNITVDYVRRERRAPFSSVDPEQVPGADSTDSVAMSTDVLSALAGLRPEQQQVVILRFVEGLASSEVAAVMGKSESAVKALQVRALQALRKFLADGEIASVLRSSTL